MLFESWVQSVWYGKHPLSMLLLPLSWLYRLVVACRKLIYSTGILPAHKVGAPVIVVGNLTVGGTGKTPLVIWLARYLKSHGYKPGIISRGYGGALFDRIPIPGVQHSRARFAGMRMRAQRVNPDSNPALVGDEPVLLAQRARCPVAVSPSRVRAAREILQHADCDILLCDDGLQHTALRRDIEIVVIDGDRRFGNQCCIPAGPLREPVCRLNTVDLVVANAKAGSGEFLMEYISLPAKSLDGGREQELSGFRGQTVHAVAAISNPSRFFSMLRQNGVNIKQHVFPDHYVFKQSDLEFDDDSAVLMTEKDAVKCRRYDLKDAWYIPIEAKLPETFEHKLENLLEEVMHG